MRSEFPNSLGIDILNYFKTHQTEIQSNSIFEETDPCLRFELLCGDMSYKRFYRVTAVNKKFILVVLPTQGDASIEIFNQQNQLNLCPAETFIYAATELAKCLSHVSPVHAADTNAGLVLLSDHGDYLFEDYVNAHPSEPKLIFSCFEKLFIWLKQFQALPDKLPKGFFGLQRTMEHDALLEELREYLEFGIAGFEKQFLDSKSRVELEQNHKALAAGISKQAHTLVHRDFQSKNIMVQQGESLKESWEEFWIIDYQDLCYGPYTYDYASIIFDPYLNLPLGFQKQLIHLSWEMNFQFEISLDQYEKDILLCAKQRLLKAAGRYARQFCLKDKDKHMKYYQPALNKAAELNGRF